MSEASDCVWEHQRYWLVAGWKATMPSMPQVAGFDPAPFTGSDGSARISAHWDGVERAAGRWEYGFNFSTLDRPRDGGRSTKRWRDCVRRRCWRRRGDGGGSGDRGGVGSSGVVVGGSDVGDTANTTSSPAAAPVTGTAAALSEVRQLTNLIVHLARAGAGAGAGASARAGPDTPQRLVAPLQERTRVPTGTGTTDCSSASGVPVPTTSDGGRSEADLKAMLLQLPALNPISLARRVARDGDAYCALLRRSRSMEWRGAGAGSGGDAAVVAAMLSALVYARAAYGYPMLHGHMDTVESSLHMHSLQRAFVFDVAGGVDPASNCTAAAAMAGLRATVECSGSPVFTGTGKETASADEAGLGGRQVKPPGWWVDGGGGDCQSAVPSSGADMLFAWWPAAEADADADADAGTDASAQAGGASDCPFLPAHFVAADHDLRWLVVAVRGSITLGDALTDLAAIPHEVTFGALGNGDGGGDGRACGGAAGEVHAGMLRAAQFVHASILPSLRRAARHAILRSYRVVFTGHSLGAGVAALLGLMERDRLHREARSAQVARHACSCRCWQDAQAVAAAATEAVAAAAAVTASKASQGDDHEDDDVRCAQHASAAAAAVLAEPAPHAVAPPPLSLCFAPPACMDPALATFCAAPRGCGQGCRCPCGTCGCGVAAVLSMVYGRDSVSRLSGGSVAELVIDATATSRTTARAVAAAGEVVTAVKEAACETWELAREGLAALGANGSADGLEGSEAKLARMLASYASEEADTDVYANADGEAAQPPLPPSPRACAHEAALAVLPASHVPPGIVLHAARRAVATDSEGGAQQSCWHALLPGARARHPSIAYVAPGGGAFSRVLLGHGCISHHLVGCYMEALVAAANTAGLLQRQSRAASASSASGANNSRDCILKAGLRDLLARSHAAGGVGIEIKLDAK